MVCLLIFFLSYPPSLPLPVSVQHLERTCSQLQSIVEDQERAIKLLEKSLKDAVTKNHIEIVLAGKMTQQEIEAMMNDVTKEIESSLGKKVDFAQADALLNTKASMSSIEALRTEMNLLRDSIRNGEGIGRMKGIDGNGSNQANPFDHYQHELSSMLQQLKDEQKKLKDEKEKQREARLAEENVSRSNTLDGANHVGRGQFDLSEKKELHDRISRLELAIQLAHAQAQSAGMDKSSFSRRGSRRSKGGPNDGHGDDSVISEQLSKLLDTRASKLRRELDDLRQRNRQVEVDTQKFQRQIDSMREGKGGSSSYGLGGDQHSKDLSQLFRELDRLESNYDALTGGSGNGSGSGGKGIQSDREWVESILLPQSNQMSVELTEIRNMLRDQSRAHRRLLDSLTDAKTSVTADINELYQQVQLLRRRLKAHTEEFTQDLLHGLHDQQQLYGEFQSFRSMIETALYQMSQHLDDNSSTLTAIQQPLYDQIRITSTHQAHIRTSTLETKYAEEYARLRQRYEEMRERIERHQKETRAHDQLSEESSQTYDIYHNINEVFQSDENEQKTNPASSSPSTPLGYFRIASPPPPPQSNFSPSPLPSSSPSSYRSVARAASAGIRPRISASISTPQSPTLTYLFFLFFVALPQCLHSIDSHLVSLHSFHQSPFTPASFDPTSLIEWAGLLRLNLPHLPLVLAGHWVRF